MHKMVKDTTSKINDKISELKVFLAFSEFPGNGAKNLMVTASARVAK